MSDDNVEVLGKWSVKFKNWTWEYVLSVDGTVTWRDPLNNDNGKGRWVKTGNLINITWYGSTTKESWRCPITPPEVSGWYQSSYGVGPYRARRIPDPSPVAPAGLPVNPAIASIPWERYLDQFVTCRYDMNYKIPPDKSFAYSSILSLAYGDGVAVEFDFESEFEERDLSSMAARDAMAQGFLGREGRIFPRVVAPATAPRLWSARADALALQEEDTALFFSIAIAAVAFVLSVPPMPAGAPISSPGKVGRQRVPGVGAGQKGFRAIPFGQTAESLGTAIGGRAAEGAKTTGLIGQTGPSWINRIIGAVRRLRLSPKDSAEVVESATRAAKYGHGPRAILPDGTIVVTSARAGPNNFVVGIRSDGMIARGMGNIKMGPDVPNGVQVAEIVWQAFE